MGRPEGRGRRQKRHLPGVHCRGEAGEETGEEGGTGSCGSLGMPAAEEEMVGGSMR